MHSSTPVVAHDEWRVVDERAEGEQADDSVWAGHRIRGMPSRPGERVSDIGQRL